MTERLEILQTKRLILWNSLDVFVHQYDEPVYVCLYSNTTRMITVEIDVRFAPIDQETIPTDADGDTLQTQLFTTNSRLIELIDGHKEFEAQEQEGTQVRVG